MAQTREVDATMQVLEQATVWRRWCSSVLGSGGTSHAQVAEESLPG